MSLGEFEPEVWVPSSAGSDQGGTISLDELARMRVIHGPRRVSAATYDAWLTVLRTGQPRFEFTDPPLPALAADDPRLRRDGPAAPSLY
jgi:hypothetical protein